MRLEITTTYDRNSMNKPLHQVVEMQEDSGIENHVVNIYPENEKQIFDGFGGAVTESAAYVYSLMDKSQKEAFLTACFSPDRMNYGILRVPVDSCDFSLEQYEAMSDPSDSNLNSFSMARTEKYILPMLEDIRSFMGRSPLLMLSPWSPPAFMKTNHQRIHGGRLRPEYRKLWAEYLCRYIQEFRRRGFTVTRMSLQNEPKAVQTWDSCIFTAEEEKKFLRDFMYPAMRKHGLTDVKIYIWDHNKERVYEWMRDIIDEETRGMIAGAAFHWYSGDHFDALDLCRQKWPDKELILSESCIEFSKFDADDDDMNAIRLSHEIIGDLNHGICAFYDWNILLDERGGPNYVGNYCLAPFLFHRRNRTLLPQMIGKHIEHFSGKIVHGSRILETTKFSEEVDVTACRRPDGRIAVILLNKTGNRMPVTLRAEGREAKLTLFPFSITSGLINE